MVVENSVTGRILLPVWRLLLFCYEESGLAVLMRAGANLWKRLWHASAIVRFASREGALSRAWPKSAACALLSVIINLPAMLLHALYRFLRPVFDGSVAAQLAFGMGGQVPAAIAWLMAGILVIPYERWNNTYSFAGFLLLLLLTVAGGMRRRSLRLDAAAVGPYAVCFATAVFLAWPLSYSSHLSMRFLFFHMTCMLCVMITVSTARSARDLLRIASFVCAALCLSSAYGFYQRLQGVEVNASFVDLSLALNQDMPGRIFGMFENPNAFAQVLVLLIPLAVGFMLGAPGWGGRLLGGCAALFGTGAILMTYSRASWIGLAAAALLFVFLWNRKILPAALLLCFAALPLLPDSVFNRILTIFVSKDSSTTSRFPLYEAALRLLAARPAQGAGLGTDAVRRAVSELNLYHGVAPFVHAHNIYLQVWAETGLLGIASFLASMGWAVKSAIRAVTGGACSRPVRLITAGGASALAGILVCGLADYIWNYPRVMLVFWFVFAVTLAGVRVANIEARR